MNEEQVRVDEISKMADWAASMPNIEFKRMIALYVIERLKEVLSIP